MMIIVVIMITHFIYEALYICKIKLKVLQDKQNKRHNIKHQKTMI